MNAVRAAWAVRSLASIGVCFVLTALAGCAGANGNKARLTGKVMYKNAPVTGGTILLYPSSGSPFSIYIKADGTFDVLDAPLGEMKAAIETDSVPTFSPLPAGSTGTQGADNQPKKVAIPPKYNKPETSGLTWNTNAEKTKTFELAD